MSTKLVSPAAVVLMPATRDPAPRRRSPRIHRRRVRSPGRRAGVVAFDARLLVAPHRDRRPRKLSLPVVQQPNLTFPLTRGSPFVAMTFPDALTPRGHTGRSTPCGRAVTFQSTSTASARDGAGGLRCHLSELRRTNRSQSRAGASQYRHSLSVDSVEEASSRLKGKSSNDPSDPVEAPSGLVNARTGTAAISLPAHIDCISDVDDDTTHSSPRDDPRDIKREKKRNKLIRRKACYRQKKDGRSRSLTHIDTLDPAMLVRQDDTDRLSEPDTTATSSRHPHSESVRRRHLSMQTKIGSSERFSVSFDLMGRSVEIPVEHIPASRGTVLREALSAACECNRVDMDAISVYLENGRTPLPLLTTETYWLGGKHLRIKARDQDSKSPVRSQSTSCQNLTPVRKSSGSYRGMVNKLMSSSAEEPYSSAPGDPSGGSAGAAVSGSNDGSLKVAKSSVTKQRWSGIFGSSFGKESGSSKMDVMIGCLDTYSRHGIPRLPHLVNFDGDAREEEELYNLEADWRDLVSGPENLSERCHQQQNAIWELVHTEAAYIHTLKVITDLFLSCLCNLQNCQILSEVDTQQLFCNIQEIYAASRHFWHEHVLRMLTKSRQSRLPLNITDMYDGFCQFEEIFHPYTRYCLDQSNSKAYCKTLSRNNGLFNGYLAWCETQKDCNRLRLVDILAKPWQRITKYSLLLKAVLKKTDQPQEQRTIREMINNVDVFVGSVDGSLRNRHEQDRVSGIMERIDAYDCVDTKDDELERVVRLHLNLDLNSDMPGCGSGHRRNLLMEGELKLRDNTYSKVDVRCFLFTDMLLVCKPLAKKGDRLRVIRPPYVVDRLLVQESVKDVALLCVYLNEYQAASAAFTLICSDSRQVKLWLEWLKKAQDRYREARMDTMSQEYVFFDDEDELEMPTQALLMSSTRSPRGGSSRSSRVPSLIHSHSSSVDNGELTARLSAGDDVTAASEESAALNTKHRISLSPRRERRSVLRSVGSTPNQLSVTTPQLSCSGQSMPDLTDPSTPAALTCARPLSPSQRGITYPPPSPRGLRRAIAAPPTPPLRNPPLTRARHVGSPSPPPGQQLALTSAPEAPPVSVLDRINPTDVNEDVFVGAAEDVDPDQDGKCRRHVRDRLENRRYHTAGVIEDMKRQELRNPGIHKRLSWNCGHQQPANSSASSSLARHNQPPRAVRHSNKCLSSESMHSSSGVSSVNSLHFSTGSEMEEPLLADSLAEMIAYEMDEESELDAAADGDVCNQSPSRLISSHVSTTYISVDGASSSGVSCISSSVQKTQGGVKIDISGSPTVAAADQTSLSRVQITVNDDPTANSGAAVRTTGSSTLASDV